MFELINEMIEATAAQIRRKHKSIKRLFPDFDAKTKGVEEKGGLKLVDQILNFCFSGYDYPSYDDAPSFTLLTSLAAIGLFAVIVRRRR